MSWRELNDECPNCEYDINDEVAEETSDMKIGEIWKDEGAKSWDSFEIKCPRCGNEINIVVTVEITVEEATHEATS